MGQKKGPAISRQPSKLSRLGGSLSDACPYPVFHLALYPSNSAVGSTREGNPLRKLPFCFEPGYLSKRQRNLDADFLTANQTHDTTPMLGSACASVMPKAAIVYSFFR